MEHLSILPQIQVTLDCNMHCAYCFQHHQAGTIEAPVVERLIAKLVEFHRRQSSFSGYDPPLTITWHGGEPLLAGIDLYRKIIDFESRYPDIRFENRLQTNGTLMTDAFAEFLAEHQFAVGFSLDGPEAINNTNRRYRTSDGNPYADAISGIERYRRYAGHKQIPIIAVITPANVHRAEELYLFFKSLEANVQLDIFDIRYWELPADKTNGSGLSPLAPSVCDVAAFLIRLFDLWFNARFPGIGVQ